MNDILIKYSTYLSYADIPCYKVRRFLTEKKDMEKYHLEEFPDKEFVKLYIKCMKINEKEIMLKNYQKLTNYVLKKLNWKDIDGWKFRSELDK